MNQFELSATVNHSVQPDQFN